ncbi:MAG: hypothetical protein HYT69_01895 [Candidatus Zambryskibacteria bacterium]|nr:hypothetical protein [Candidatus Zambryskibacteria bacterium]
MAIKVATGSLIQQQQKLIREAPVINGFSYPFLRLLVSRAKELEEEGELVERKYDDLCLPTVAGAAILHQISQQTYGDLNSTNWSGEVLINFRKVIGLLNAAEELLAIFEK